MPPFLQDASVGSLAVMRDQASRSLRLRTGPGKLARLVLFASALALTLLATPVALADEASSNEIDATIWNVISATVAAGDLEGMAATYHEDAVLVSSKGTVAIAEQLVKWGEGMERARVEGRSAVVSFRFTGRQDDQATAFERGIFRYAETDADGVEQPTFIPFEALLVKKDGRWLIVMERQHEATDKSAWGELNE